MATVTNDIVTRFAFEGSLRPLSDFNSQMSGSIKFMAAFGAALAAAGAAVANWVTDISAGQDAIGQLARNTGVSVEALGELGYAAEQSGSSADALQSSISSLSQKIGEASIKGSEDFSRIGISIRGASGQIKTADKIFLEFSNRVKQLGLTRQQTQDFASGLGIDESLVQLLSKSSAEINQLRSDAIKLGRTTTEQSDSMLAYNDSLNTLGRAYEGLKVQIAVGLIPQLQELARGITTWLVDSSDTLVSAFKKIVEFTLAVSQSLVRMAPVLLVVAGGLIAVKVAALGLSGALAALGKLPIIAALTGIYLVIDDVITAFQGGESVIADFYSKFTDGRVLVDDMKAAWKSFGEAFIPVIKLFERLWGWLDKIGKWISSGIMNSIATVQGWFSDDESELTLNRSEKVSNEKNHVFNPVVNPVANPAAMLEKQSQYRTNNNVNQNVQIEVRSSDPVRAGEEVKNQFDRQTEDAFIQSGVAPR